MKQKFAVALTGGIASGKSTVAGVLRELGAAVLDADAVTHALYEPGGAAAQSLARALGPDLLDGLGAVDRPRLAERLFRDAGLRRRVEAIVHPLVMAEVASWLASLPVVRLPVVEIPLLFESGHEGSFASVVVVTLSEEAQAARLEERHPEWVKGEALRRVAAQMPLADKARRAHHVIDNSGTREELRAACRKLYAELLREKERWEAQP